MSDEQKKKISNARIGKYKGKDHPFAITIQCVETGEIFYSIKSAIEWCGGTPHIYECIYGNRKSAGKFRTEASEKESGYDRGKQSAYGGSRLWYGDKCSHADQAG